MKDIRKLKEERARLVAEARSIMEKAEEEKRDLTEDEGATFRVQMEKVDKAGEEIDREERVQALEAEKADFEEAKEKGKEFASLGEFIHTVRFKPQDERLVRAQSMDAVEEGGYLVPPQYMTTLLTVGTQEAIVRPRATVIPADAANPDTTIYMPAIDYTANRYGGVEVAWIDEAEEKPETDMAFRQVEMAPKEVAGHIVVNDKLLQNYSAAETLLSGMLRSAIIAAEDTAFLNGAVGGPTGIIGHACVADVPRDGAGAVSYVDLVTMYSSVKFGGSLVFVANPTVLPQLMLMEDTAGHLIWQPNAVQGAPGTILGIPVLLNERSPVLGTEGDLVLADLKYYLIKDGYGMAVAASEHVYFTTNKTVVKAFKRVDGAPWLIAPMMLEDGETEVSPFVVLSDEAS